MASDIDGTIFFILLQSAKFCSNPTTGGGVMTSYRFFKMAAIKKLISSTQGPWI